jgi:hypothetical protein
MRRLLTSGRLLSAMTRKISGSTPIADDFHLIPHLVAPGKTNEAVGRD